jgi:hypothetical protein
MRIMLRKFDIGSFLAFGKGAVLFPAVSPFTKFFCFFLFTKRRLLLSFP